MERRAFSVRGTVQGVGFRPFVHGLASQLSLTGFVRNAPHGVEIEVEGDRAALDRFEAALLSSAPTSASIDACIAAALNPRGDVSFEIQPSDRVSAAGAGPVRVTPDIATCADCLAELRDPSNRRFGYAFITCAACGPRLTIATGVPYDRERTTMASFSMCDECRGEYDSPRDRRFHAETIACPACGPRLSLTTASGATVGEGESPIGMAVSLLRAGAIVAVKGLGGFHLACDATRPEAVTRLRAGKHRDEKPLAVMFASLDEVSGVCDVDTLERQILLSAARPIVLLPRRASGPAHRPAAGVAPGCPWLGVMLPSTPLHHLLLDAMKGPLVMTSGNRSDEPILIDETLARDRLDGIADAWLAHDRRIHVRCDDGVTRVVGGRELPVRRSRGHAPRPLRLPVPCRRPTLAVGAQLKNTFALGQATDAVMSHHMGDLDHLDAYQSFEQDIRLYEQTFVITPELIVHDAHPAYASTVYARQRAARSGLASLAVQHHHAHVASCMAEHDLREPVIGVAFDGSGDGGDGTVWGGEFLVGDLGDVKRVGHFRQVRMAGADQAIREPWRMALAHAIDAGLDAGPLCRRVGMPAARVVEQMIARGINAPFTSSVGRLFDAVAVAACARDRVSFEGQAAMQLEWLATGVDPEDAYGTTIDEREGCLVVDTRPMMRSVARDAHAGVRPERIARRFHTTLADVVAEVCGVLRERLGLDAVVLTGGVFQNALLTLDCEDRLARRRFRVYRHHSVPPGDGGISLGQLAVAAARS